MGQDKARKTGAVFPIFVAVGIVVIAAGLLRSAFLPQTKGAPVLRTICSSLATYRGSYGGYPPTLSALGPPLPAHPPSPEAADLIDGRLAEGEQSGYRYTYRPKTGDDGKLDSYTISKDPIDGQAGSTHYFTDDCKVIHAANNGAATSQSGVVEWKDQ